MKGGGGTVSAAFTRRGRVALVATTAPRHGNRSIHPGTKHGRASPRLPAPARRSAGRSCAGPRSPRLLGIRRGKVRYVAVTSRRTISRRGLLRAYLRLAGV